MCVWAKPNVLNVGWIKLKSAVGKILKTWVGLTVGKWCRFTAKLSTEFGLSRYYFGSHKSSRLVVRLLVALSSFRLAYNDCVTTIEAVIS